MKPTNSTEETKRHAENGEAVRSSVAAEKQLRSTIDALMDIVEGVRGERWAANGMRLVDTKEWCAFYVASRRYKEQQADTRD